MSSEMTDWNIFATSSESLTTLGASFLEGSLSSYHSALSAITFTVATSINLYSSSTSFSSFTQSSTASNNLIGPLLEKQTSP